MSNLPDAEGQHCGCSDTPPVLRQRCRTLPCHMGKPLDLLPSNAEGTARLCKPPCPRWTLSTCSPWEPVSHRASPTPGKVLCLSAPSRSLWATRQSDSRDAVRPHRAGVPRGMGGGGLPGSVLPILHAPRRPSDVLVACSAAERAAGPRRSRACARHAPDAEGMTHAKPPLGLRDHRRRGWGAMQQPPFAPEGTEGTEGRVESPGGGPGPGVGTGGAEPLPCAPPARAGEARRAAGSSASGAEAGAVQSPGEPQGAAEGLEGHSHPRSYSHPNSRLHQHPFPSPAALGAAPFSRHPPARQPGALTWKRFFTQIFFMLLQSPAGPVTRTQARQDGSPLPAGSPLSARRGSKRCSEHPSPPAAGSGGGRGRGSPGWALGRAGAVSMKHHWSAPPSILPPPASASASPPALAHSDSGGGQAGHRWWGARATVVEGREGGGVSEAGTWFLHLWLSLHGRQGSEPPDRQCSCTTVPCHLSILPHCQDRGCTPLSGHSSPTTAPTCRPTGMESTQHSRTAVPNVLSNRADSVPQLAQACTQQ